MQKFPMVPIASFIDEEKTLKKKKKKKKKKKHINTFICNCPKNYSKFWSFFSIPSKQ